MVCDVTRWIFPPLLWLSMRLLLPVTKTYFSARMGWPRPWSTVNEWVWLELKVAESSTVYNLKHENPVRVCSVWLGISSVTIAVGRELIKQHCYAMYLPWLP